MNEPHTIYAAPVDEPKTWMGHLCLALVLLCSALFMGCVFYQTRAYLGPILALVVVGVAIVAGWEIREDRHQGAKWPR